MMPKGDEPKATGGGSTRALVKQDFWPEPTGDASCWKSEISYLCGRWTVDCAAWHASRKPVQVTPIGFTRNGPHVL